MKILPCSPCNCALEKMSILYKRGTSRAPLGAQRTQSMSIAKELFLMALFEQKKTQTIAATSYLFQT